MFLKSANRSSACAKAKHRFIVAFDASAGEGRSEKMAKHAPHSRESAEILAVQALAFIAEDSDRLAGFISSTGIAPPAIRAAATDPDFLAGVLEHMLGDETLLIAFADSAGIDPAGVARARQVLGKICERDLP
jgi:hypothetical protein